MAEWIVFAFDICSSTVIVDDLHRSQTVDRYFQLILKVYDYLKLRSEEFKYQVYKLLGGGFILLFDPSESIDRVLTFSIGLTHTCDRIIHDFISHFVEFPGDIPRKGITIGVDKGILFPMTLDLKDQNMSDAQSRLPVDSSHRWIGQSILTDFL